jgi:hypothetical protein
MDGCTASASGIISEALCLPYELYVGLESAMIVFAVRMLEGMFLVGILGSVLVVVLTAFDDIRELLGRHDEKQ